MPIRGMQASRISTSTPYFDRGCAPTNCIRDGSVLGFVWTALSCMPCRSPNVERPTCLWLHPLGIVEPAIPPVRGDRSGLTGQCGLDRLVCYVCTIRGSWESGLESSYFELQHSGGRQSWVFCVVGLHATLPPQPKMTSSCARMPDALQRSKKLQPASPETAENRTTVTVASRRAHVVHTRA